MTARNLHGTIYGLSHMVPPQEWMQFVFIIRSYLCFREPTSGCYQGSTNTI